MLESKEGLNWFGETGMDCENQTLPGPALGHDLRKSLTNIKVKLTRIILLRNGLVK